MVNSTHFLIKSREVSLKGGDVEEISILSKWFILSEP